MTEEEIANLKLKLELRKRKAAATDANKPPPSDGYQPASPTTEESSWFETIGNTAKNFPGSAGNVVSELARMVTHPGETAEGIRKLDVGSRQWLETLGGEHEEATPEMDAAKAAFDDFINTLQNPAISFSNDPAGFTFDLLLGKGLTGKTLRAADAPTDVARITKHAENVKDAIYAENTGKFPGTDISNVATDVKTAAGKARYHPKDHADLTGLGEIINRAGKSDPWIADLTEVSRLRGNMEKVEGGGRAPDSGLIGKTKEAFDIAVRDANPEMADALDAERLAYQNYKNTKGLADMLTSGKLKGAIRGDEANQIKQNITRTLTNARTKKGYADLTEEMEAIVKDAPSSSGLMNTFIRETPFSASAGAALGGAMLGIPGSIIGGGIGAAVPPILRKMRNAKAGAAVDREMLNLIREINGLPPAKRHIRMQQLSPAKRAALIALGIGAQEE